MFYSISDPACARIRRAALLATRFFFGLGILAVATTTANAQKSSDYQIGDVVEVQVNQQTVLGEVVEFVGPARWLKVKYGNAGRERFQDVMPNKATKIDIFANPLQFENEADRTWTDSTGKFKIEARVTEVKATEVTLEKKDRSLVTLPWDKLSKDDQIVLRQLATRRYLDHVANTAESLDRPSRDPRFDKQREEFERIRKKVEANARGQFDGFDGGSRLGNMPFDNDPNMGFDPNRNTLPPAKLPEPVVVVTLPEPISFQAGEWIMRPTAAPDPPASYRDRKIGESRFSALANALPTPAGPSSPTASGRNRGIDQFAGPPMVPSNADPSKFSNPNTRGRDMLEQEENKLVSFVDEINLSLTCRINGQGPIVSFFSTEQRLKVVDLQNGTSVVQRTDEHTVGAAVSPSGTLSVHCLSHPVSRAGNGLVVKHFDMHPEASSNKPNDNSKQAHQPIKSLQVDPAVFDAKPTFVMFLDEDHVLTAGKKIILWDIKNDRVVYVIDQSPLNMTISRDGTVAAVVIESGLRLLELRTGKVMGHIDLETTAKSNKPRQPAPVSGLDFSADGKRLVAGVDKTVHGWDLTTGEKLFSFEYESKRLHSEIKRVMWVEDKYVLVNSTELYDPLSATHLWHFSCFGKSCFVPIGASVWYLEEGFRNVEMIDAERRTQIARLVYLTSTKDERAQAAAEVKKTPIALRLDFRHMGRDAQKTQTGLEKLLTDNNYVLDDNAPLKLHAVVKRENQVTEDFNPREARVRLSYYPHVAEMTLISDGKLVWSHSKRFTVEGPRVYVYDGESDQDAVDRLSRPSPAFFLRAPIPGVTHTDANMIRHGTSKVDFDKGITR